MLFKKSFVSLVFTYEKLQILQLNSKKTSVLKFAEINLPQNLIKNYKVESKPLLVQILRQNWQRLGLEEKSVGLVIPEFSTFTKSIFLPSLTVPELDEAVRWQAQDFLPLPLEETVMDWKIVSKVDGNFQILVVAIPREVIASFVDATEESGLFPLVVETPSLSLSRLSATNKLVKLVIYANFEEAILVLANGEDIIASSVVNSADQDGVLWTAVNMVKHYQALRVEKIEIGGLKFTQQLVENLKKNIDREVHWIQPKISGLTPEQIQQYLVPISLQFKNPVEPRDETTIILLPQVRVEKYQQIKQKKQTWSLVLIASFIIWGCFLTVLLVYLLLSQRISSLQRSQVSQAKTVPQDVLHELTNINETSGKVITLTGVSQQPQEFINAIDKAKPPDVIISSYQIDFDLKKISVKGNSVDRQSIVQFKQNLEADQKFSRVNIPLSTFEGEQNAEFELTFSLKTAAQNMTIPIK